MPFLFPAPPNCPVCRVANDEGLQTASASSKVRRPKRVCPSSCANAPDVIGMHLDAWAGCGPGWPRAPHGSGASPDGSFGTGTPRLHWEGCAAACARPFTSLSPRPELSGPPLATNGQRSEAVVLDRGRCAPSVTWQRLGTLLAVAQGWGRRLRLAGRSQAAATCPHCPESPHSQDRQPEMPGPPGLRKWFSLERILHRLL